MSLTCEIPSTRSEQAEQASMRIELSTSPFLLFFVQARSLVKVAQAQSCSLNSTFCKSLVTPILRDFLDDWRRKTTLISARFELGSLGSVI